MTVQQGDRPRPILLDPMPTGVRHDGASETRLANALALDVTYDVLLTRAELLEGGRRIDRALQVSGILPFKGKDFRKVTGELYDSDRAAERDIQHAIASVPKSQIRFLLEIGYITGNTVYRGQPGKPKLSSTLSGFQIRARRWLPP